MGGRNKFPRLIALFTALPGALNVLSAITPASADRLAVLDRLLPMAVQRGGSPTAALSGFALLILSNGLWRRKRTACCWLCGISSRPAPTRPRSARDYAPAVLLKPTAAPRWHASHY